MNSDDDDDSFSLSSEMLEECMMIKPRKRRKKKKDLWSSPSQIAQSEKEYREKALKKATEKERGGSRNVVNLARDETPPPGAEIFSTELITGMSVPDSEMLRNYLVISDSWKPRWNEPVQVPNSSCKIPKCSFKNCKKSKPPALPNRFEFTMPDAMIQFTPNDVPNAPLIPYDMDQEDEGWLEKYNQRRGKKKNPQLDNDCFERIMGVCERECYVKISHCIHARSALGLDVSDETCCCVCYSSEAPEDNEIVFCDGCDIAVHQVCYGIVTIPEGIWLCNRCSAGRTNAPCALCPDTDGAMKPTVDKGVWAHVNCSLWIPEVVFQCAERMEPIDIGLISRSRMSLTCFICKERVGACIQCCHHSCTKAFHVTCGFKFGLNLCLEESKNGGVIHVAKCDKHSVASTKNDMLRQQQKEELREQILADSAMDLFEVKFFQLFKSSQLLMPDVDRKTLNDIYEYWVKKRKTKGKPLMREYQHVFMRSQRFVDAEIFGTVSLQAHVKKNLERVRLLAEYIKKRELLKLELMKVMQNEFDIKCKLWEEHDMLNTAPTELTVNYTNTSIQPSVVSTCYEEELEEIGDSKASPIPRRKFISSPHVPPVDISPASFCKGVVWNQFTDVTSKFSPKADSVTSGPAEESMCYAPCLTSPRKGLHCIAKETSSPIMDPTDTSETMVKKSLRQRLNTKH